MKILQVLEAHGIYIYIYIYIHIYTYIHIYVCVCTLSFDSPIRQRAEDGTLTVDEVFTLLKKADPSISASALWMWIPMDPRWIPWMSWHIPKAMEVS